MRLWRYSVLWYLGGMAYTGLELLWRGWSHGSMFAAGGTCFLLIGHLGELDRPLPLTWRMLTGAGITRSGATAPCPATFWGKFACPSPFYGSL